MFNKKIKLVAIYDYYNGLGFKAICRKYGIKGSATLYEWIRKADQFGIKYFSTNAVRHFKLSASTIITTKIIKPLTMRLRNIIIIIIGLNKNWEECHRLNTESNPPRKLHNHSPI